VSSGIKMFENIKVEEVGNGGSISMSHPSGVFAAQTFTVIQKRNSEHHKPTSQRFSRANDSWAPTPGQGVPNSGCRRTTTSLKNEKQRTGKDFGRGRVVIGNGEDWG